MKKKVIKSSISARLDYVKGAFTLIADVIDKDFIKKYLVN